MIIRLLKSTGVDKSFPFSRFHSTRDFSRLKTPEDAMNSLSHDMLSMEPRPWASKILCYFLKKNDATNMIHKMCRHEGENDYHMNIEIKFHCRMGRVELGFGVLGRFFKLGYVPNVYTHNTLLEGLLSVGHFFEAEKLLEKLLLGNIYDRDATTIRTVMDGLCESEAIFRWRWNNNVSVSTCAYRMIGHTFRLYMDLLRSKMRPNSVTYSSFILGLCKLSCLQEAMGLLRDTAYFRISLNRFTYDSLVDELGKKGWIQEAEEVLEIMMQINVPPDITTYSALINGYCATGNIDKAREIFDRVVDEADILTFHTLIGKYCRSGRLLEARQLFEKIPSQLLEEDGEGIHITMLLGLFKDGRFDDGLKFLEEIQNKRRGMLNAYRLLAALCHGQCAVEALSLLNVMETKGLIPANDISTTYNLVIVGLCRNKRIDLARNVFNNLPSKGLQPDFGTRVSLVCGLCEQGMLIEAKDMMTEMEGGGCFETYNSLVKGYLQRNQLYEVIPLMVEMAEKGFKTSDETKKMFLSQVETEGDVAFVMHNIEKMFLVM